MQLSISSIGPQTQQNSRMYHVHAAQHQEFDAARLSGDEPRGNHLGGADAHINLSLAMHRSHQESNSQMSLLCIIVIVTEANPRGFGSLRAVGGRA